MKLSPNKLVPEFIRSGVLIIIGIIIILLIMLLVLFFEKKGLSRDLRLSKDVLKVLQDEIPRIQTERDELLKVKEKLQSDLVTYLDGSAKLQNEKNMIDKELQEAQKNIVENEIALQRLNGNLEKLNKKGIGKVAASDFDKLKKENIILKSKFNSLNAALKKEKAEHRYNLGVLYMQVKLYDKAISELSKSLNFAPDNPDAHYNLGLLYGNVKDSAPEAAAHFRKYLELKPNAEDKDEVKAWIAGRK